MIAITTAGNVDEAARWLAEIGAPMTGVNVITDGTIYVEGVGRWIGLPAPEAGIERVNLRAPEPLPGERDHWLHFGSWASWTSDLMAIRVEGIEPPTVSAPC